MTAQISILTAAFALMAFIIFKGFKKQYAAVTADTYFSVDQTNWLRGIAILGIVYSHYLANLDVNIPSFWMVGFLGVFGVAIFLFLSGYSAMFCLMNKPHYLKGYIPKRLSRLYLPFLIAFVFAVPLCLLSGYSFGLIDFGGMFIMSLPGTLNWYLKVQLGLYILFFVFAKLFSKGNSRAKLLSAMFLCCAVYMVIGYLMQIESYWYISSYMFPVGMLFCVYKAKVFNFLNSRYIVKLIVSFIIFVFSFAPEYLYGSVIAEWIFILGFMQFLIVICVRFKGNSKLACLMGTVSLEFYLSHCGDVVPSLISLFYDGEENLITFVIFLILSLAIAYLIKVLSSLLLKGIGKLKKQS